MNQMIRYAQTDASLGKMINKYQTKERSYPLLIGVGKHDNEMA